MSIGDGVYSASIEERLESMDIVPLFRLEDVKKNSENMKIRLRGFIFSQRVAGKRCFTILRSGIETLQCTYSAVSKDEHHFEANDFKSLTKLTLESFVEVLGIIKTTSFEINKCTIKDCEVVVLGFKVLSSSDRLPFMLKDLCVSEEEKEDKKFATITYCKRLNDRSLDLRAFHSQSIFRVIDTVMYHFRTFLRSKGFIEIKTSKLVGTSSEGGANCFQVDFIGKKAFLAQSPQLYKQMAVLGGFKRVYEIGHVYRAEESNINRYLSEFTGLDIEMEIESSYHEVMLLVYELITCIFDAIKFECKKELEIVRAFKHFEDVEYGSTPLIFTHSECVSMLNSDGIDMSLEDDFNREAEKRLGSIVKK